MRQSAILAAVSWMSLAACDKNASSPSSEPAASATVATTSVPAATATATATPLRADDLYVKRCTVCHGKEGKGDGPGAAALEPKPRTFADPAWQKAISDDQIRKVIVGGGTAVGKSAAMPANPDLKNKPEVVDGLVQKVRGFAP